MLDPDVVTHGDGKRKRSDFSVTLPTEPTFRVEPI